jgi:threonine dehydrogenase-like Zn-dependent dehydrogenase
MKRAVFEGAYNFVIKDVPKPEVGPGQTLVKVRYCSICGSDVHLYKYDKVVGVDPLADSFRKAFGIPIHSVIGHQISGDVVETGEGVTYCKVGDRVALQGPGEGYAEYVVTHLAQPVPDSITYEQAAYLEPLNVALNAVKKSRLGLGDIVVVQGAGTVGLSVLQCVRAAGAAKVIVTEMSEPRLKMARELGADEVINVREVDPVERVTELTGGLGPSIVFECTGNHEALEKMVEMLPFHGQGMIVASYEHLANIDYNTVMIKSLDIQGVLGADNLMPIGIALIQSGRIKMDPLYSSIVPLEKINEAMKALLEGKEVGVIVEP